MPTIQLIKTVIAFSMFKSLPVGQVINAAEEKSTTDMSHYIIFVRDSDWAEPVGYSKKDNGLSSVRQNRQL